MQGKWNKSLINLLHNAAEASLRNARRSNHRLEGSRRVRGNFCAR